MPLRRYLSRRIIHRSFTLSKSSEIESITGDGTIQPREENDCEDDVVSSAGSDSWAGMLPELLGEIIQRVEASEGNWPQRQNVVVCGCVCKRWRDATAEAVEKASLRHPGKITFPSSLKKPGSRDSPIHCLMKRDKKNSTFYLYLALTPSFTEKGKFLLAARRYRNGAHTEYIITLDANDPSPGSKAYVGKLRSDFTGTSFKIFDSQPPHSKAKPSSCRSGRRVASKQISPQIPTNSNFEVGQVSYKFNLLKSRGPRRMVCSLSCPSSERVSVSDNNNNINNNNNKKKKVVGSKIEEAEPCAPTCTILKNKTPRWHENLECWCLNFHGRVTFASVKNFQLIATVDQSQPSRMGDEETVLLQFGKVGDDTFTLDYRQPLSAFQAFAICLTSFGTKLACE